MQIKNDYSIRSIQHYLYCAHRWGLIEIGKVWAENYFVTKANLLHQKVHETNRYTKRGKKVLTKWQEKKRTDYMHPHLKQKIPFGLIPYVQSNLLAKYVRGEIREYPCFLVK